MSFLPRNAHDTLTQALEHLEAAGSILIREDLTVAASRLQLAIDELGDMVIEKSAVEQLEQQDADDDAVDPFEDLVRVVAEITDTTIEQVGNLIRAGVGR